jgi:phage baseplate assembly protein V
MSHELVMSDRGQAVRGVVHGVDDTGAVQLLVVETHAGVVRAAVEVHQPFGLASHAPADGAVTLLVSAGGDQGDMIALPPANPQAARFGNLGPGEVALYDAAGNRLIFSGGTLATLVCANVVIQAQAVAITAPAGVTITGPVQIAGTLTVNGDIVCAGTITDHHGSLDAMRTIYDEHTHTSPGTNTPTPAM